LLVLGGRIPDSLSTTLSDLFPAGWDIISELHKLNHSPKLVALHEILEVCGIGVDASGSEAAAAVIGQHRVLIFAQHKVKFTFFFGFNFFRRLINSLLICHLKMVCVQAFLDIIEKDLFQAHMKT
jgi:TATA-binding protein-associated factor